MTMAAVCREEILLFPKLDRDKLEEHAFNRELRRRQHDKLNGVPDCVLRFS